MPVSISAASSPLAWLSARLGLQRGKIADLLRWMRGLGTPGAMKPVVFAKFLRLLDQVASAREEEMLVLSQIETIERRHRFRREHHQLMAAEAVPEEGTDYPLPQTPDPREQGNGLLWLGVFWYLFVRKINQKKQSLTSD